MHACIYYYTLYENCYAHETRGVFLALGCELRYNTADRARAKARSRSYAAMYTVYDAGVKRLRDICTVYLGVFAIRALLSSIYTYFERGKDHRRERECHTPVLALFSMHA